MSGCANSAKGEKPVTSFTITTKAVQIISPVTTQSRYTTTADTRLKAYIIITNALAAMRVLFCCENIQICLSKNMQNREFFALFQKKGLQNELIFPYTSEKNFSSPSCKNCAPGND